MFKVQKGRADARVCNRCTVNEAWLRLKRRNAKHGVSAENGEQGGCNETIVMKPHTHCLTMGLKRVGERRPRSSRGPRFDAAWALATTCYNRLPLFVQRHEDFQIVGSSSESE